MAKDSFDKSANPATDGIPGDGRMEAGRGDSHHRMSTIEDAAGAQDRKRDLNQLTEDELIELAHRMGIEDPWNMGRRGLVDAIRSAA